MTDQSYWTRRRISRRSVLRGASLGFAGLAGAALVGCGEEGPEPTPAPAPQSTAAPTGTSAPSGPAAEFMYESGAPITGGTFRSGRYGTDDHWSPAHSGTFVGAWTNFHYSALYDNQFSRFWQGDWPVMFRTVEEVEFVDDTTAINHLRSGVRFHDVAPANGRAVTAEDVVATMKSRRDDPTQWIRQFFTNAVNWDQTTVVDDRSYRMILKQPRNDFFDQGWINYVPKEVAEMHLSKEKTYQEWESPPASGAWRVTEHVPGSHVRATAHDGFSRAPWPYIGEIHWSSIPDAAGAEAQFRSGGIDVLYPNVVTYNQILKDLGSGDRPKVYGVENLDSVSQNLSMNAARAPFNDERVRKAVHRALDLDRIIELFGKGAGAKTGPTIPVYYEQLHVPMDDPLLQDYLRHDPAEATQLLAAARSAGVDVDRPLDLVISSASADEGDLAALLKSMLEGVGLRIQIVSVPGPERTARTFNGTDEGNFDLSPAAGNSVLAASVRRAHTNASLHYEKQALNDPEIDAMVEAWEMTPEGEGLVERSHALQRALMQKWTADMPLFQRVWHKLLSSRVRNTSPVWVMDVQFQQWIDDSRVS